MRKGPRNAVTATITVPEPGRGEVVVKVLHTGICGSDIHRFSEENPKWDTLVLGHEFSGEIAALGEHVTNFRVKDRVTAAPLIPCHSCDECQQGNFSLCTSYQFIGSRVNGTFSEYVLVPEKNLVLLGPDFPLEAGAFIEPVTVCLHPILKLGNLLGKRVAVTGLGAIGLIALQIFKAMGAAEIVVSDVVEEKLELAKKLGATRTVNVLNENLEKVVRDLGGAHVVFESSGNNQAKKSAVAIAKGGGEILLVGTSPNDITFDAPLFERITRKELKLIGSWMNYSAPWPGDEWHTAVWMLKKGLIEVNSLTTHRFTFAQIQDALDVIFIERSPFIKILLSPGGEA